jgi:ADP-heptose:LPS heptosyltransferase
MVILKDRLDCISCVKNTCPLSGDEYMQCMKQITVDEVYETAAGYLS